ncbi:MAG: DUF11 domain-containing protein [Flavobacteriales bacterium]|nr:DUF11 domain-containing protein [Flavobacteriales bacterium]
MGSLWVGISSGVPPYNIQWSNGATTETITALPAGTYTVTVTDATMEEATAEGTITDLPSYPFSTFSALQVCPGEVPMVSFWGGTENGMPPDFSTGTQHGPGPYGFNAPGYSLEWLEMQEACGIYAYYNIRVIGAQPGAGVTINYTDGSGCPGSFDFTVPAPVPLPTPQPLSVTGSCTNGNIGSALVSVGSGYLEVRLKNSAGQYLGFGGYCAYHQLLPNGTVQFTGLAPGSYWVLVDHDTFDQYTYPNYYDLICRDSVEVVIPDLGSTCGLINGRVFVDNNSNCALNSGENLVPTTVVQLTPGPYYATTNDLGFYSAQVPLGTYDIEELHPVLEQSCPVTAVLTGASLNNMNVACAPGAPLDVQLTMGSGPARPGFEVLVAMDIDNLTPDPTGTVVLTFTHDPVMGFVTSTPLPSSIVGNTITWTAPQLTMTSAFQHRDVNVRLQVPPDVGLLGTELQFNAGLTTQNTDVDLTNNSVEFAQLVTGSYDPNDKLATTSDGNTAFWHIGLDEWVDYTIRFQNTGTDTAFNVVITDTLPANLDVASITWGAASHAHNREVVGQGILRFIFPNIMLPDSNVNEPLSHGFVCFRIRPHLPLLPGDEIENIANIYFDYNSPVITEPSILVATTGTGVEEEQGPADVRLVPNPASDKVRVISEGGQIRTIRLRAMDGRVIMEGSVVTSTTELDIAGLTAGAYMVECILVDQARPVQLRFIKL